MKRFFVFLTVLVLVGSFVLPVLSQATTTGTFNADQPAADTQKVTLQNPLGNATPQSLIGNIINAILGIVGSLALLMFIYGGITWMTSSGSAEKVKKGRDIMIWTAIGLAIIFFSYALVNFVIFDIIGA